MTTTTTARTLDARATRTGLALDRVYCRAAQRQPLPGEIGYVGETPWFLRSFLRDAPVKAKPATTTEAPAMTESETELLARLRRFLPKASGPQVAHEAVLKAVALRIRGSDEHGQLIAVLVDSKGREKRILWRMLGDATAKRTGKRWRIEF